ncbi:MAG: class IV adenylate cyclase [Treponema sp.]|nr:class IV adenylate cyclase [Treponema sp.]
MTEIELKAHVSDKSSLKKKLASFAEFEKSVVRDDTYYASPLNSHLKIRLRTEQTAGAKPCYFVTYKRKELKTAADSIQTEVNEELESELSSPHALEQFLCDCGFQPVLKKRKEAESWKAPVPGLEGQAAALKATLEICTVPPLGDFLEIEILSPETDSSAVSRFQEALAVLLEKAGIEQKCIESRYYSDLLSEAQQHTVQEMRHV